MNESTSSLTALLDEAGLLCYEQKMRALLKIRDASDVVYVDEKDFVAIGMTRPEQKRLRAAYHRLYPRATIMGKIKKKLLGSPNEPKKVEVVQNDEDQHVIPLERIELGKKLGKGEFGSVYQAVWNSSSGERIQVAAKCVSTLKMLANSSSFLQEAAIMHKMRHEFVVRLYGVVLDTKTVMLVSELASCGSLLECLRNPSLRETFFIDTLCEFCIQIASGMKYLASKRLIHRDLAARNVLVFSPNKVKIADFGLSRLLGVGEYYYRGDLTEGMKLPIAWCAPESINFLRFTSASDVWSFGVTMFELFSYGETPWGGLTGTEILSAVDYPRNERLSSPQLCPADYYRLMHQCWAYKPEERPTFSDILKQLNDISPQSLITVAVCNDGVVDHLQYIKNEVIVVLDKQPSEYPDGYYWMGCIRDGRKGLFRPANTVARLGAENPCGVTFTIGSVLRNGNVADKVDKEKDRKKKKKVVISEPQNDLRHTCHIGIDGSSFGVIPCADKLSGQVFPLGAPSCLSGPCSQSSHKKDSGIQPEPPGSPNTADAVFEAMSSRINANNGLTSSCSTAVTSFTNLDSASDSVFTDQLLIALPRTKPATVAALPYRGGGVKNVAIKKDSFDDDASTIAEVLNELNLITNFSLSDSSAVDDVSENRPLIQKEKNQRYDIGSVDPLEQASICRVMSEGELERWEGRVDREHRKASKILNQERSKEMDLWRRSSMINKEDVNEEKLSRSFSNKISSNTQLELSEEAQNAYKLLVQCGNDLKYGSVSLVNERSKGVQATGDSPLPGTEKVAASNSARGEKETPRNLRPTLLSKPVKIASVDSCDLSPLRQLRSPIGSAGLKFQANGSDISTRRPGEASTVVATDEVERSHLEYGNDLESLGDMKIEETSLYSVTTKRPLPPRPIARIPPPVPPKPKRKLAEDQKEECHGSQGSFASAVANSVLFANAANEEILNF